MKNLVDIHTHTVFSNHAFSSLTENVDFAVSLGMKYLGISDHQPDKDGKGAKRSNFTNLKVVPNNYRGLNILKGIELNVGPNFKNSIKDFNFLNKLDYYLAGFHTYDYEANDDIDGNTEYYIDACKIDKVKVLVHIDDGRFPCDFRKVIETCIKTDTLIEINNSSLRQGCSRLNTYENLVEIIKICKELNCPVILNSDAHIKYDVGNVDLAYGLCKDLMLSDDLIVNRNTDLFKKYLGI